MPTVAGLSEQMHGGAAVSMLKPYPYPCPYPYPYPYPYSYPYRTVPLLPLTRFHEALGVYQKEMTKSGGDGLNRGGGGKNYSIDATAMVG